MHIVKLNEIVNIVYKVIDSEFNKLISEEYFLNKETYYQNLEKNIFKALEKLDYIPAFYRPIAEKLIKIILRDGYQSFWLILLVKM